ncbi:MAG: hypothetical protein K9K75_02140, partial [Deltaproteobacteria bacterium]|nr:hypothetical protein [Deltaproteobacteria bacterium]
RIEKKIKPALSRVFIWSAPSLFTGCFVVFGLWFMLSPGEEGTFVARVSSGFKLMYNEITKEKAAMVQEEQIVVEILPSEELRKISVVMGDPLVFVDALYRNVVVQKGKVINRTGYKLQAVRVEGMLYDEEAEIIKKNFSIAGNEVDIATIRSNTQDQGYDAADKKGQIFSRSLTSVSNATILPIDGEASFMLVFYAEKNDKVGEIPYVVATVRDAFQLQHAGERSEARGI